LLNLACLIIILSLLVGIKGLVIKTVILSLLVITVALVVICANCFQIHSQKPWDRSHDPRESEPSFENQVKNLCDHVKLISEKLGSLTPNEKRFVLGCKGGQSMPSCSYCLKNS
jgi:hypothetical protein